MSLTIRDFKDRFNGTIGGFWWLLIILSANILIYTFIFSNIFSVKLGIHQNPFAYGIYLAIGLSFWNFFSTTISRITSIFVEKRNIISKISINLLYFPISVILTETIILFITLAIIFLISTLAGMPPTKYIILILFSYIFISILSFSVGLILAVLNVFIRDISQAIGLILNFLFWLTPVVYTPDILPKIAKNIININPLYPLITISRLSIFPTLEIPQDIIFYHIFAIFILFVLSIMIYNKLQKPLRDAL